MRVKARLSAAGPAYCSFHPTIVHADRHAPQPIHSMAPSICRRSFAFRPMGAKASSPPFATKTAPPALWAVDHDGAGAAHPHPAGIAEGERRILLPLDLDERIEHRHPRPGLDAIGLRPLGTAPGPPQNDEAGG